jgi:hypothetical protein
MADLAVDRQTRVMVSLASLAIRGSRPVLAKSVRKRFDAASAGSRDGSGSAAGPSRAAPLRFDDRDFARPEFFRTTGRFRGGSRTAWVNRFPGRDRVP